jgi:hypothetical protein
MAKAGAGAAVAAFELLPCNKATVDLFLAVQTQWKTSAFGQTEGLDYPGVRAAAEMMGIEPAALPAIFEGLQLMEYAALAELNDG